MSIISNSRLNGEDEWDMCASMVSVQYHPLELNDKIAFEKIRTVKMSWILKDATSPIPRFQELEKDGNAFGSLTGRSILVSISHGWFFQTHPDPIGVKLDMIRNIYIPKLMEKYPHTDIQIFLDYWSTPQRPRTEKEESEFQICMTKMNSMYLYADVVISLDMQLSSNGPYSSDVVIQEKLDIAGYKFMDFLDITQVDRTRWKKKGPQRYDIIVTIDKVKLTPNR